MASETYISYEFAPYHVLLAAIGTAIFVAYWVPRLVMRRSPPNAALLMIMGCMAYAVIPGMPEAADPTTAPHLWELTSELVVIIVLFTTGLRIDNVRSYRLWRPTVRLLLVAMPLTIAAVATLAWGLAGMTVAGALLLGAVLAPTDPVLAGDVQVGPPLEGNEHPVRFTLTAEAGLNDGLAFPFVHLGVLVAALGADPSGWLSEWVLRDLLYRISVGVALGAGVGWLLGRSLFSPWGARAIEKSGPGVIALAAVLLCYGLVEMAEGYGFIGVFMAGLVCRRVQERHHFHRQLHLFSEAIEHALTAILLVLVGSTLPVLWPALDWRHSVIGFSLLLLIRPIAGWLSLRGTDLPSRDRWIVGFFGVRGIGSIYYVAYAAGHMEFINESQIWALVAFTVFASAVIHGMTSFLLDRLVSRRSDRAMR